MMTQTILLDLNSTYAANASDVHLMHKGIYNVHKEHYRKWLTEMLRGKTVVMLTSRPHSYRDQTLSRIKQEEGWEPYLAYFNKWRMKAPQAKKHMLETYVYPQFGNPEHHCYVAIESNWKTQDMFMEQGIRAFTQQELQKSPTILLKPPIELNQETLF